MRWQGQSGWNSTRDRRSALSRARAQTHLAVVTQGAGGAQGKLASQRALSAKITSARQRATGRTNRPTTCHSRADNSLAHPFQLTLAKTRMENATDPRQARTSWFDLRHSGDISSTAPRTSDDAPSRTFGDHEPRKVSVSSQEQMCALLGSPNGESGHRGTSRKRVAPRPRTLCALLGAACANPRPCLRPTSSGRACHVLAGEPCPCSTRRARIHSTRSLRAVIQRAARVRAPAGSSRALTARERIRHRSPCASTQPSKLACLRSSASSPSSAPLISDVHLRHALSAHFLRQPADTHPHTRGQAETCIRQRHQ